MEKEILEKAAICLYLFHGGALLQIWFIFRGSMSLGGAYPLPLMSKGENEAEVCQVAIKSKGGDCWHYVFWYDCMLQMLYLMATPVVKLSV